MAYSIANNHLLRKHFQEIKRIIDIPNLIDIQKNSYQRFLQAELPPSARQVIGLEAVFRSVFPIKDFSETCSLEYVEYTLGTPKYDVEECHQRGMTFAAPMKVKVRLVSWDVDKESGIQSIRDIKEQEVYFGEIPLMTANGTFIINGTERVIVSQLHRSPGVFFDHDKGKTHASGKLLYNARVIPYRGSWLDFDFDHKDILFVRIDRRRKLPATVLLKALGYSAEELLNIYYDTEEILVSAEGFRKTVDLKLLPGQRAPADVVAADGEVIVKANRKFTRASIRKLEEKQIKFIQIPQDDVIGKISSTDIVDQATGEVIVECNQEITIARLEELKKRGIDSFRVLFIDNLYVGPYLRETLLQDRVASTEEAIIEIYRRLRPGDPPTLKSANALFDSLFFNPERYDLSTVGRLKLNHKLGLKAPLEVTTLTKEDILQVVRYLIDLRNGVEDRRHRPPRQPPGAGGGRTAGKPVPVGLVRMERAIKERMSLQEVDSADAARPDQLQAGIGGGQGVLRFEPALAVHGPDQSAFRNHPQAPSLGSRTGWSDPRARRLRSARRASDPLRPYLPDRDAGRPEHRPDRLAVDLRAGQYPRLHRDPVPDRSMTGRSPTDPLLLGARRGGPRHRPGQRRPRQKDASSATCQCPKAGEFMLVGRDEIELMDVSPKQLVSVAASLIPFLENDDANRALMGSNMQRQAVPCCVPMPRWWAPAWSGSWPRTPGSPWSPSHDGMVESVDAGRIVVKIDEHEVDETGGVDIYNLIKFTVPTRTPASTRSRSSRSATSVKAARSSPTVPPPSGASWPWAERGGRLHAVGRLQLRGLDPDLREPGVKEDSTPRSTSRSSSASPATPSSARKRSPTTSRTSVKRP
jgi:DNA-directed RNA polymerase subunit beta